MRTRSVEPGATQSRLACVYWSLDTVTDEQWEVTMQSQIGLVHIGPRDVVPAADGTLEVSFLAQVAGTYHLRARLADGGTAAAGFNALFTVLPAE